MKKKILIIIGSILLFIGVLIIGVKYYTKYRIGYQKVYVASHQLYQRTCIGKLDLIEVEVPKDYLKDDVFIDPQDIIGKYVKLSYSIPKGSLIYKSAVESDINDLANTLLKQGEVNYDIYTNDVKINTANIMKNMYIDLYLTINNKDKPVSDLLIENARVTGMFDSNNKPILDYDSDTRTYIVSLAIDKDAVNIINKALTLGSINCVVNNNTYNTFNTCHINSESPLFQYLE